MFFNLQEENILSKNNKKSKYNDITEVENLVDSIIQKNKVKLEKVHHESIEQTSLESRRPKNNRIYYIKKTSKKTKEKDILSGEIISQARENLGEAPVVEDAPIEEIREANDKQVDDVKVKRRFLRAKKTKNEEVGEFSGKLQRTDDIVESKEYDEVVSEIEKSFHSEPVEKIVEKKVKEKSKGKIERTPEDKIKDEIERKTEVIEVNKDSKSPEEKAVALVEEHNASDKKTDPKKIDAPKIDHETSEDIDVDESKFLDEQITESEKEETPEKEEPPVAATEEKTPDTKPNVELEQPKEKDTEDVFRPRFKVENMPKSQELPKEQMIIDEKLKKGEDVKKEEEDTFKDAEQKAQTLFEKHVKEVGVTQPAKPPANTDNSAKPKAPALGLDEKDAKNEHVFFDEDDVSFSGWSPSITEREKKDLESFVSGSSELDEIPVGEVNDIELPKEVLNVNSVKLSELGFSENEWEELDFYPLNEPYSYVEVLREKDTLEKCYFLVEIDLTEDEQQILDFINDTISGMAISTEDFEDRGDNDYLSDCVNRVIKEYDLKIPEESFDKILYYLGKTSLGLGKLDPVMRDPNIEDISCDGAGVPLFLYHRNFGSLKSNITFDTEEELSSFIFKLAQRCGKHISIAEPMLDATMPDGSRIQMTLGDEITARGSTFTIRKFRVDPFSPPDLVEFNTMSAEMIAYMWIAVEHGINMLFAGGTASGKTTALNALSLFIPPESKIVSIEETREINLPHTNWIPGVARTGFGAVAADKVVGEIDMYDLMKAALRQRPEYILVGEIRGREAYVLFQAMATGHATYSTVHADSAHSLIHRLEGKPINIPRVMLQSLDVVSLHVTTRVKNKRVRRCKQIIEIIDIDPTTKEILTNEVFRWDPVEDRFVYSGKSYVLERIRAEKDMSRDDMAEEIKRRKRLIELMNQNNVREFRGVARLLSRFNDNPEQTIAEMEKVVKKK